MENNKKSTLGAVSLTLGIVSIASSLFWYVTLPAGVIGIVLGARSKKHSKMSTAGLVTSIIGLSIFVFIYASVILSFLSARL